MRRGKPPREHRWLSWRRGASLEDVGDVVRSARTLRSMAELVSAAVERRARMHASGWAAGVGGRALYSSGGWPVLSRF